MDMEMEKKNRDKKNTGAKTSSTEISSSSTKNSGSEENCINAKNRCHCRETEADHFLQENHRHGSYQKDKKKIVDRLNRVEGQIRGVKKMVEEERYCVEVLDQIAAARSALDSLTMILFRDHTTGCVSRAIKSEESEKETIEELMQVIQKFIR